MTTPPSRWPDRLLGLTFTFLTVALMLYVAAKLIEAVLPVLIGVAGFAAVVFMAWSIYQFRRSRW